MHVPCVRVCGKLIFFFLDMIEILLLPNLSVYVYKTLSWKPELRPLPPTPHKYLILVK